MAVIGYQVQSHTRPQTIEVLGQLHAYRSITLHSPVTETIHKLHFKDGEPVKKGQLLVELNNREERAQLEKVDVVIREAKRQYDRANQIKDRGNITQSLIDERYRLWQSALADKKIIQAQLADRRITAPFSGQIGFRQADEGALVSPSTPIATLDQVNPLLVDLQLPDRLLNQIALGQTVKVTSTALPQQFEAQVVAIAPRVNPQTRQIRVRALLTTPEPSLKSGLMVQAQIELNPKTALQVPNTAILMRGEQNYVYQLLPVPDDETRYQVKRQKVTLGKRGAKYIEVLSGLQANDLVASDGLLKIGHQKQVRLKALDQGQPASNLIQGQILSVPTAQIEP